MALFRGDSNYNWIIFAHVSEVLFFAELLLLFFVKFENIDSFDLETDSFNHVACRYLKNEFFLNLLTVLPL